MCWDNIWQQLCKMCWDNTTQEFLFFTPPPFPNVYPTPNVLGLVQSSTKDFSTHYAQGFPFCKKCWDNAANLRSSFCNPVEEDRFWWSHKKSPVMTHSFRDFDRKVKRWSTVSGFLIFWWVILYLGNSEATKNGWLCYRECYLEIKTMYCLMFNNLYLFWPLHKASFNVLISFFYSLQTKSYIDNHL